MNTSRTLLQDVEDYCRRTGVSVTTFGIMAVNDPNLVRQLRGGRDVRLSTLQRIQEVIASDPSQQPRSARS